MAKENLTPIEDAAEATLERAAAVVCDGARALVGGDWRRRGDYVCVWESRLADLRDYVRQLDRAEDDLDAIRRTKAIAREA